MYFGRLDAEDAAMVVEGYERGIVDLDHYRGRAGEPFAAQAAEHFLRARTGILGIDDLVVTSHRRLAGGMVEVGFDGPGGRASR